MRPSLRATFVAALTACALVLSATPAFADGYGHEGCTPGFWKNHEEDWQEFDPQDLFGDVFGVDAGDLTLIDALQGGGGQGIGGAQTILARAAVAALLNAAHDDVGYPLNRNQIIAFVQNVWDSGDRDAIIDLADGLDRRNNFGCPL